MFSVSGYCDLSGPTDSATGKVCAYDFTTLAGVLSMQGHAGNSLFVIFVMIYTKVFLIQFYPSLFPSRKLPVCIFLMG